MEKKKSGPPPVRAPARANDSNELERTKCARPRFGSQARTSLKERRRLAVEPTFPAQRHFLRGASSPLGLHDGETPSFLEAQRSSAYYLSSRAISFASIRSILWPNPFFFVFFGVTTGRILLPTQRLPSSV